MRVFNYDITLEMRDRPHSILKVAYPALALIAVLALGAGFVLSVGVDPLRAYSTMLYGAFGNQIALSELLIKATPLMLVGLGIAVAFRASFYNIGAEGQFILGSIGAAWLGLTLTDTPAYILIPAMMILGAILGALWALIPGILKAQFQINEIIVTIMMNFVAMYFLQYLLNYSWRDPLAYYPQTPKIAETGWIPVIVPETRIHLGVPFAIFLCVVFQYILWRSSLGYEIRVAGMSRRAAEYAGISVYRATVAAALITGGAAGLAGAMEVAGVHHFLLLGISSGYGFLGIVVALLAKLSPLYVIPAAIIFGAILNGSVFMQRVGVPYGIVLLIQSLMIIMILVAELIAVAKIRVRKIGV